MNTRLFFILLSVVIGSSAATAAPGDFTLEVIEPDKSGYPGSTVTFDLRVSPTLSHSDEEIVVNIASSDVPTTSDGIRPSLLSATELEYAVAALFIDENASTGTYELVFSASDSDDYVTTGASVEVLALPYQCPEMNIPAGSIGADVVLGYLYGENTVSILNEYITKKPEAALGLPDEYQNCIGGAKEGIPLDTSYSIGLGGGYIDLGFTSASIVDAPGPDFYMAETGSYSVRMEAADVTICGVTRRIGQESFIGRFIYKVPGGLSQPDASTWVSLYEVDLADYGTSATDRIRVSDNTGLFRPEGTAGYDLDGIAVLPNSQGGPLDCQAEIKNPKNGKRINGNRVNVMAEFTSGDESGSPEILFQYRYPSGSGVWANIIPAVGSHPNPDTSKPYFVHWDVTSLLEGDYDLRAVATCSSVADSDPDFITVTIDHTNPQVTANTGGPDSIVAMWELDASSLNELLIGDPSTGSELKLLVDTNYVSGSNLVAEAMTANALDISEIDRFSGGSAVGTALSLDIVGATSISSSTNGFLRVLIGYPELDQDFVVDGTGIDERSLFTYRMNDGGTIELLDSTVDPVRNHGVSVSQENSMFFLSPVPGSTSIGSWQEFD